MDTVAFRGLQVSRCRSHVYTFTKPTWRAAAKGNHDDPAEGREQKRGTSQKVPRILLTCPAPTPSPLRSLGWGGRYLVVGFAAGDIPKLPLNLVLLKGCDVRGVFWGSWTEREPAAHHANMADIVRWCAQGKLSGHVHASYPLADAAQAFGDIASRKAMGKVVLTM